MGLNIQLALAILFAISALTLGLKQPDVLKKTSPNISPYARLLARQAFRRLAAIAALAIATIFVAKSSQHSQLAEWCANYTIPTAILLFLASEVLAGRLRKHKWNNTEMVVLMNEQGKALGPCPRPLVHNGSMWLHAVVHLHVFDNKRRLLLQLRPNTKKIQPGKWDTAVGGHIAYGEKLQDALKRETYEEIGLNNFEAQLTRKYIWTSDVEQEYVFVFETTANGPFETKNVGEVDELRFWNADELRKNIDSGVFTPNFEKELKEDIIDRLEHTTF